MNLVNFISNNWDSIAAAASVIGGLLWHKGKSVKLDDLWESMLKIGRQAFTRLLEDKQLYNDAHVRQVIIDTIWAGLERLQVKKTPTIEKWVAEAAEHIKGELAELVMKHHFGQLVPKLEATAKKLDELEVP